MFHKYNQILKDQHIQGERIINKSFSNTLHSLFILYFQMLLPGVAAAFLKTKIVVAIVHGPFFLLQTWCRILLKFNHP